MDVQINWIAVLLAAASSMVVGSLWYGKPLFMVEWQRLTGMKVKKGKELQAAMTKGMVVAVLTSLLMAFVLAHMAYLAHTFYQGSFMSDTLTTALWLFLGFQATRLIMADTFEGRPTKLTWINVGNAFVTLMVMGLIIGALKP